MTKKYSIEYSIRIRGHTPEGRHHCFVDDSIACEELLEEMLDRSFLVHAVRRDGADVSRPEFDRLIKIAASRLASRRICTSLDIKPDEERARFGFAA